MKFNNACKALIVFSGTILTMMLSVRGSAAAQWAGIALSLAIWAVLTFKQGILKKALSPLTDGKLNTAKKIEILLVAVMAAQGVFQITLSYYYFSLDKISALLTRLSFAGTGAEIAVTAIIILAALAAFPAAFTLLCAFVHNFCALAKKFVMGGGKTEKRCFITASLLLCTAVIVVFSLSNVFYDAVAASGAQPFVDLIYSTDSPMLVHNDVYMNINSGENDIRQPLFGVFAMPFAIVAKLISYLLFFIPNIYIIALNCIQVLLLVACAVMLCRLLELKGAPMAMCFAAFTLSYPFLLFSLNMEQYIFPVFWLMLLVYSHVFKKKNGDLYFIAAASSLVTTGIAFPLLSTARTFKAFVKDVFSCGVKFVCFIIVFGQLPLIYNAVTSIKNLLSFAGTKLAFNDKLLQFFNFISSCFIAPETVTVDKGDYFTYQLSKADSLNILGLIFLAVVVIGFVLNYKKRYAQICMGWVGFSFILLCVIGWGTLENGLILYSLYFSWAYFSLAVMAVKKLLSKRKGLFTAVCGVAAAVMAVINLQSIYELVLFGINNYPVR